MINLNNKNWNCFTIYQCNSTFEYLSWKEGMRQGLFWAPLPDPSPLTFLITCGLRYGAQFFDVQQICWYQPDDYVRTCAFERLWVCLFVCMRECVFMWACLCHNYIKTSWRFQELCEMYIKIKKIQGTSTSRKSTGR